MSYTAVAAYFNKSLDVKSGISSEVTFNSQVVVDIITDKSDLFLGQIFAAGVRIDAGSGEDLVGRAYTYTENIGKSVFQKSYPGITNL